MKSNIDLPLLTNVVLLLAAMEMGILGTCTLSLFSRSKAITLYNPLLAKGMVKLLLLFRRIVSILMLVKSSESSDNTRITQTRAPGERVPSTYTMLTVIQFP